MRPPLFASVLAAAVLLAAGCGGGPSRPASVKHAASPSPSASPLELASPSPGDQPGAPAATCPSTGQTVTDAGQLTQALTSATPGTVIHLAPGTYQGQFVTKVSGTSSAPISLCGSRDAVLDGGNMKSGYTLHLDGASWWHLVGFTVQDGQKGVMTDAATHVLISGLYVHEIGDEAIHLRSASTDDIVENVTVRDTGHLTAKFGEGIYVGSAKSNWCKYGGCGPDQSDRDVIRDNDISQTSAENIDVKEGTTGGTVSGNRLSGDGMVSSAATAWVNVKGNSWTITGNVGQHSVGDGFQVHQILAGWGEQNVFRSNQAAVDGPGYGYYVHKKSLGTVVTCDNTATGAGSGLSNVQCT